MKINAGKDKFEFEATMYELISTYLPKWKLLILAGWLTFSAVVFYLAPTGAALFAVTLIFFMPLKYELGKSGFKSKFLFSSISTPWEKVTKCEIRKNTVNFFGSNGKPLAGGFIIDPEKKALNYLPKRLTVGEKR